jgi:signal transduction histidine kinase
MTVEDLSANTYIYTQDEAMRRIAAAADGDSQTFDWRLKRSDGELVWIKVWLDPIEIAGQNLVKGEIQDITQYKNTERRVQLFHRILRHNLRNKMNIIAGTGDQIVGDSKKDSIKEAGTTVVETATGLMEIAEAVREIESSLSKTDSNTTPRRVRSVITDIVDRLREEHPNATFDVQEANEKWAAVDEKLAYATEQALENAVIHHGGQHPRATVDIDDSPNTGRVRIRISDENPPIPVTELEALDYNVETTSVEHGSGIGLFVMKWCIEALGGEMKFDRDETGNVVTFLLPPCSRVERGSE